MVLERNHYLKDEKFLANFSPLKSLMAARVVPKTHLVRYVILNFVDMHFFSCKKIGKRICVKIVKHIARIQIWKNKLFQHPIITLLFEAEFLDVFSISWHFFTVSLYFYLWSMYFTISHVRLSTLINFYIKYLDVVWLLMVLLKLLSSKNGKTTFD